MTDNLLCFAGTNTLVSCSSRENDILHMSLETHLKKSKHTLFYYTHAAKFHLQFLYSTINTIHEQYIYFICTIQVMYIYTKCVQYSMNTITNQERKQELSRKLVTLVKKGDIDTFKLALEQHENKIINKYYNNRKNRAKESQLVEYFAKKVNLSNFRYTLMLYENIIDIQVGEKEIAAFKAKRPNT